MDQSPAQWCVCHLDQIVEAPTPGSMPTGSRSLYFFAQIEPLGVGQPESNRFQTVLRGQFFSCKTVVLAGIAHKLKMLDRMEAASLG